VTLLRHYLSQGGAGGKRSFPKGIFKVLARTDFKTMFSLVPEAAAIVEHMDAWVTHVLDGLDEHAPVVGPAVNYDESGQLPDLRIDTTRGEWLRDMPEADRLTGHGHKRRDVSVHDPEGTMGAVWVKEPFYHPEAGRIAGLADALEALYQGMGGYKGNVDVVQYQGAEHPTPAVILEIRNPPTLSRPDNWKPGIERMFGVVDDAIRFPHGKDRAAQDYDNVPRAASGVRQVTEAAAHRVRRALLGLEADVEQDVVVVHSD
jgi:hypothetical protein